MCIRCDHTAVTLVSVGQLGIEVESQVSLASTIKFQSVVQSAILVVQFDTDTRHASSSST